MKLWVNVWLRRGVIKPGEQLYFTEADALKAANERSRAHRHVGSAMVEIDVALCPSLKTEGSRSWRCQLQNGHDGEHRSISGRRRWST